MRAGTWLPLGLFVVSASWAGCAAGDDPPPDDTTSAGGSTSTQQGPTSSSSDGSGSGGMTGQGGGGGTAFPCGQDCSAIMAPQCFKSVCNMGEHMGPIGSCVVVPEDDGTACDDEQFCTVDDTCQAGVCTGGPQNTCGMTAAECQEITCDEATNTCAQQAVPDGGMCTPGDLCVENGTCTAGSCVGTPKDCFFSPVPNECHQAVCNPANGMCEPVPANDGQPCVDTNDLCSVNNTCNAGTCQGGVPKDCSHLTLNCDLGVCNPMDGQCDTMAVMDGQMCDDLDGCTTGEICTTGTCGGGSPVTVCSGATTADGCCPSTCNPTNDLDCACSPGTLLTSLASNNGSDGNMFDIVAKSNVTIDGFDVNVSTGSKTIEIYYRPGSYVGFENSSAGWTLVGSATVTSNGQDVATPVPVNVNVTITQGQTYAFYVTTTNGGIRYINGTGVGNVYAEDSAIQFLEGAGKSYPFGTSTFTPRVWSGNIHYTACGQ